MPLRATKRKRLALLARVQAVKDKAVFAKTLVKQESVRFQIDCGANADILPYKYVGGVDFTPCSQSLVMWNARQGQARWWGALPATSFPGRREPGTRLSWREGGGGRARERFNGGGEDETKTSVDGQKVTRFRKENAVLKFIPISVDGTLFMSSSSSLIAVQLSGTIVFFHRVLAIFPPRLISEAS